MNGYANLIDTTLREGEQTPGISLSLDQKKTIIDGLAASGGGPAVRLLRGGRADIFPGERGADQSRGRGIGHTGYAGFR